MYALRVEEDADQSEKGGRLHLKDQNSNVAVMTARAIMTLFSGASVAVNLARISLEAATKM